MLHRDSPFYIRRWVQTTKISLSLRGGTIDAPGPYNLTRVELTASTAVQTKTGFQNQVDPGNRLPRVTLRTINAFARKKSTSMYNVVTRSNTRGYEDKQTASKEKVTICPSLTNAPGKPMMCF